MRKFLRYADVLVLFSGALGLLLRLILRMAGTDERGLYPANHPAWITLCILSVLFVGFLWLLTRDVGADQRYRRNFPASIPGAVGNLVGAVGLAVSAFSTYNAQLQNQLVSNILLLNMLCFVLGLLGAAGLAFAAFCRFTGKKPHFLCHALPAAFFTLRIFVLGQALGAEPEIHRFLFEMLSCLAMIPACYQLWGFDVDQGRRNKSLFWSLTAAYLSMVAIVGMENWLLYLCTAAWLMTNLCTLKYLPQRRRPATETAEEVTETVDESAETREETTAEIPAEPAETSKDPLEDLDPDAILADILRQIDENVE